MVPYSYSIKVYVRNGVKGSKQLVKGSVNSCGKKSMKKGKRWIRTKPDHHVSACQMSLSTCPNKDLPSRCQK